jgi:hypothetical protein
LGWLIGIGAGPLLASLAGIGIGSAQVGFTGALVGMGFPEYEAKQYEGQILKGGIMVAVRCKPTKN